MERKCRKQKFCTLHFGFRPLTATLLFLAVLGWNITPTHAKTKRAMSHEIVQQHAKTITVKGKVTDKNGESLPGVNVLAVKKGQQTSSSTQTHSYNYVTGVVTDVDGNYSITFQEGLTLAFSYVGFFTQYKEVSSSQTLNVILEEDTQILGEVVVTGYERIDRRESASSVFSVKAEDVLKTGVMSIDQMLQGEIPGVAVINTSGEPSTAPRIRIRGNATINGNKSPVWVVDGVIVEPVVPLTASDINSEDADYLIGNAISGLNPQDIESITVLKDASATAIYGVKAANGVIVITTKEGKVGSPRISYNGDVTINQRPSYRNFDRMNSQERILLSKEIVALGYKYPRVPSGDSYEGLLEQLYTKKITQTEFEEKVNELQVRNTDWYGELFRTSVNHSHNVSISGGGDRANYYFSVGYNQNYGAAMKSESDRFTSLAKLDVNVNRFTDFMIKLDYSSSDNKGYHATVNPHLYAYKTSRTLAPYEEDGSYAMYSRGGGYDYNFIKEMEYTGQAGKIQNFNALFNLRFQLMDGLDLQSTFSLQNSNTSQRDWAEEQSYYIATIRGYNYHQYEETDSKYQNSTLPFGGILNQNNTNRMSYTFRNTLNFRRQFKEYHNIQSMAGVELRSNKYKGVRSMGYGWTPSFGEKFMPIYTDNFISSYLRTGLLNPINTNSLTQVASAFATFAYTYKYRYTINTNIRSDGSNKFGSNPKYRWLPTWSIAGKWTVSEEPFMEKLDFIDNFAFRGSYGIQGNIHDDSSPELIVKIGNKDPYSGLDNSHIYRLPNPDLRWERTNSWNIATDFSFWNKRIKGSFEVYSKHTTDLIYQKAVAASTGQTALTINSGVMNNKGFEGFLSADIIRGKMFDWRMSFNFARNTNEVIVADKEIYSDTEEVNLLLRGERAVEGKPIGAFYSYRFAGLSPENGYPLFYAKDGSKVHIGSPYMMELVYTGSIFPKLTGGFDTQLVFKKRLSLGVAFSYSLGSSKRLPMAYDDISNVFDPLTNVSKQLNNRWKKPGDEKNTNIPAIYDKDYIGSIIGERPELTAIVPGSRDYLYPTQLFNYSDERVAKTNYLRLRNVTLSYIVPKEAITRLGLQSLVLRLQANNLYVWKSSKWGGLDPETPQANIPVLPSYSLGVNLSF